MMRFLNLPVAGRRAVIERQKESVGLPGMSIEKDLWVSVWCWFPVLTSWRTGDATTRICAMR